MANLMVGVGKESQRPVEVCVPRLLAGVYLGKQAQATELLETEALVLARWAVGPRYGKARVKALQS